MDGALLGAGMKNMCKKTRKRSAGQCSMGAPPACKLLLGGEEHVCPPKQLAADVTTII